MSTCRGHIAVSLSILGFHPGDRVTGFSAAGGHQPLVSIGFAELLVNDASTETGEPVVGPDRVGRQHVADAGAKVYQLLANDSAGGW